jgi:hypothetical protein
MAIAYKGSYVSGSTSNTGSDANVVIPSNSTFALICFHYRIATTDYTSNTVTLDSQAASLVSFRW